MKMPVRAKAAAAVVRSVLVIEQASDKNESLTEFANFVWKARGDADTEKTMTVMLNSLLRTTHALSVVVRVLCGVKAITMCGILTMSTTNPERIGESCVRHVIRLLEN